MRGSLPLALTTLAALGHPALAYKATLTGTLLQDAYAQGTRLATSADAGYPLRPYTLYAVP
uniref:hypothetical protein n=1 Tax=Deinococcus sp. TaxID=47478 RepID=UPI002869BE6E